MAARIIGWGIPAVVTCCMASAVLSLLPLRAEAQTTADSIRTFYGRGRVAPGEELARAALARPFARTHADSVWRGELLDLLAEAQWRARRATPAADSIAEAALDWRRAVHGDTSDEVARSIATRARLWRFTRSSAAAAAGLEDALARHARHAPEADAITADMLVSYGNIIRDLGRAEEAIEALRRAADTRRRVLGPGHRDVARALTNMALACGAAGHVQQEIDADRAAAEAFEQAVPFDSTGAFTAYLNLSAAYMSAHRGHEASAAVARTLALAERMYADEHEALAVAREYAGMNALIHGDPVAARRFFDRCEAFYAAHASEARRAAEAAYRLRRAALEQFSGNPDEAMAQARRAEALVAADHAADPVAGRAASWAAALDERGFLHARNARWSEAESAFVAAAGLYTRARGADHHDVGSMQAQIAMVRLHRGMLDSVAAPALRAADLLHRHGQQQFARMTEGEALSFRERGGTQAIHLLLSLLCIRADRALAEQVWAAIVRDHGAVAEAIAERRQLLAAQEDPVLHEPARRLVRLRSQIANAEAAGRPQPVIDSLRTATEQAEGALAQASARFARGRGAHEPDARGIAAALPAGSVLVQFVRFNFTPADAAPARARRIRTASPTPWYAAFVVVAGEPSPSFVELGDAAAIEAAAERWQAALAAGASPDTRSREAAASLRKRLWEPLARFVNDREMVLIVPDGVVSVLPLATLPGANGEPLLESAPTMHQLTSVRDLLRPAATGRPGRALLLGGADFSARPAAPASASTAAAATTRGTSVDCRPLAPGQHVPLPGTLLELDRVGRAWGSAGLGEPLRLTGAQASEAAFRRHAAGQGLLHLATHGFFIPDSCDAAAAGERIEHPDWQEVRPPTGGGRAMLRTGLVLAGADRPDGAPDDDGMLTAADLAMLDLDSTRLVVLSACESGRGRIVDAEGVVGLRSALRQAGVRTTLTSCHRVNDEATARWMEHFYAAWLTRGLAVPAAAREASRALRRELLARGPDRPGQWGAFLTAGDWR